MACQLFCEKRFRCVVDGSVIPCLFLAQEFAYPITASVSVAVRTDHSASLIVLSTSALGPTLVLLGRYLVGQWAGALASGAVWAAPLPWLPFQGLRPQLPAGTGFVAGPG